MNNLNLYDWSQLIGWTLFHSLWQAAIIGAAIYLIFRFISKDNARVRYALSGLGLILICIASAITFYLNIPKEINLAITDLSSQTINTLSIPIEESIFFSLWEQISVKIENSFPILVNTWMIGMFILSLNLILKYINTQRLKKQLTFPLRPKYKKIANKIINKYQLKQKVIFKESGLLEIPSVIGYFKPVVLLPVSILSGIPENQLEIIIAHELAHISRHDYLLQFIQGIIELVFFYHPIVWWLSSVVNTEREHICDDLAVKICGESLTLIKALNNMEAIRKKQYEMVLAFSGQKGKVITRIARILRPKVTINPRRERFMLSGVFTLLFVGFFLISNLAISSNTNTPKRAAENKVLQQEYKQAAILLETTSSSTFDQKVKSKTTQKTDSLRSTKLIKEIKVISISTDDNFIAIDSPTNQVKTDSIQSEKWAKKKADKIIRKKIKELNSPEYREELETKIKLLAQQKTSSTFTDTNKQISIFLNGNEISKEQLDKLNQKNIKSINVFKNKDTVEKIAGKDTNGLIFVTSKNNIDINKEIITINPDSIHSVTVLKNENTISTYGKDGTNGGIVITSKSNDEKTSPIVKMKLSLDKNSPLFIVNGKIMSQKEIEKIPTGKIKSINVIKGQDAINKYGNKAKNGAVIIDLK